MIAVDDDLAFRSARQFEIVEEGIARVVVPLADIAISIASVVGALARIVLFSVRARTTPQFDPRHLDVAHVVVAVTWIEVIEHRFTSDTSRRGALRTKRVWRVVRGAANSDRRMSVRVGLNEILRHAITQRSVAPCSDRRLRRP